MLVPSQCLQGQALLRGRANLVFPRPLGSIPSLKASGYTEHVPSISRQPLGQLGRSRRGATIRASATQHQNLAHHQPPTAQKLVIDVAGKQLVLETGEIGRQANAAIMATMGETVSPMLG